jgi:hypothetical protein
MRKKQEGIGKMRLVKGIALAFFVLSSLLVSSGYCADGASGVADEALVKVYAEQEAAMKQLQAKEYENAYQRCGSANDEIKAIIAKLQDNDPKSDKVREITKAQRDLEGDILKAWGKELAADAQAAIDEDNKVLTDDEGKLVSKKTTDVEDAQAAAKILEKINAAIEKLSKAKVLLRDDDRTEVTGILEGLEKSRIIYDGKSLTAREKTQRAELFRQADEMFLKSRELFRKSQYNAADQLFEEIKAKLEEARELFGQAGSTAVEVKRRLDAIENMRADLHIEWARYLINEAKKSVAAQDVDDALAKLNIAKEIDPSRAEMIDSMANAFRAEKRDLEFKEETKVDIIMPDTTQHDFDIKVKIEAGIVLMKNGRYSDARDSFETVLISDPYNLTAIRYLSRINDELKKIADERREQIFRERLAEVRWKWAEPVTPLACRSQRRFGFEGNPQGS